MICPICEYEFDDDGCEGLPEIDWDEVKEAAKGDPNELNTKAAQALLKQRDDYIKIIPLWLKTSSEWGEIGSTIILRRRLPLAVSDYA